MHICIEVFQQLVTKSAKWIILSIIVIGFASSLLYRWHFTAAVHSITFGEMFSAGFVHYNPFNENETSTLSEVLLKTCKTLNTGWTVGVWKSSSYTSKILLSKEMLLLISLWSWNQSVGWYSKLEIISYLLIKVKKKVIIQAHFLKVTKILNLIS